MLVDYWAHRHFEDPNLQAPLETEDFDEELAAMEQVWKAAEEAKLVPEEDWETVAADTFGGKE